jgi:hypothetical protein
VAMQKKERKSMEEKMVKCPAKKRENKENKKKENK